MTLITNSKKNINRLHCLKTTQSHLEVPIWPDFQTHSISSASCQGKYHVWTKQWRSPNLQHWQSMSLGNSAPSGPEATRKAEGPYANTLMKSTILQSATQIQWQTFRLMMKILKRKKIKAPAPSKAENKIFPKRRAPRKLHSHALKKFSFDFLQGKTSHKF